MRASRILVALSVAVATIALSACGSDSGSGSTTAPAAGTPAGAAPANRGPSQFGSGCGSVPASGPGSFEGMTADPVATAASHNPLLSSLSSALQKANLVDTLNSAHDITVFAPANSAFQQLPQATMDRVLGDNARLTKILTYHVIGQRIAPGDLASGNFNSMEGATISTSGSGQNIKINGNVGVICGNVQTANATVYIIDGLLMPPGK